MKCKLLFLPFLIWSMGCSDKHRIQKVSNNAVECEKAWIYFKLDQPIRGKVLSYTKGMCGYFMFSSNTIILTSKHDTIRVLRSPCNGKIFLKSDYVLVTPVDKPDSIGTIGDTKFDCKVKRSCFAEIIKI